MSQATAKRGQGLVQVAPDLLERWMREGETVLVDVREDFEHATERIRGAMHVPLGKLDAPSLRERTAGKRVVFHCRSGKRSADAAAKFCMGDEAVYALAGGIEAWKASGRDVERSAGGPRIDVMRQVQITAGFLVVTGVVLGFLVSPWFFGVSAFVGTGLMVAGATGFCGMAKVLAKMPWNRVPKSACATD